ncbi:hypothetical protein Hanom_Chr01g00041201 [Helianthus anomalus]
MELKRHTDHLSYDYKEVKMAYDKLSKTIKEYEVASREDSVMLSVLKATVMDKQMAVNIHLDMIAKLKKELENMKIERNGSTSCGSVTQRLHT